MKENPLKMLTWKVRNIYKNWNPVLGLMAWSLVFHDMAHHDSPNENHFLMQFVKLIMILWTIKYGSRTLMLTLASILDPNGEGIGSRELPSISTGSNNEERRLFLVSSLLLDSNRFCCSEILLREVSFFITLMEKIIDKSFIHLWTGSLVRN